MPSIDKGVWDAIISSWLAIDKVGVPFTQSIKKKVVSGQSVKFWKNIWHSSNQKLECLFPRLFALENNKDCHISDRWRRDGDVWVGCWDWRCPP